MRTSVKVYQVETTNKPTGMYLALDRGGEASVQRSSRSEIRDTRDATRSFDVARTASQLLGYWKNHTAGTRNNFHMIFLSTEHVRVYIWNSTAL